MALLVAALLLTCAFLLVIAILLAAALLLVIAILLTAAFLLIASLLLAAAILAIRAVLSIRAASAVLAISAVLTILAVTTILALLAFYADDVFNFSLRHFTQELLNKAAHEEDLHDMNMTLLTIDGVTRGIGSSSCGPDTREEYRLNALKGYSFSFTVIPKIR